jgi:hypothetical protein
LFGHTQTEQVLLEGGLAKVVLKQTSGAAAQVD